MSEIRRPAIELNTQSWMDLECLKCGKKITLWENGGELDVRLCCGVEYRLQWPGVPDLVMTTPGP